MLPKEVFVSNGHPWKALNSIEVTDEGIETCANDEQQAKAESLIEVTEEGIMICVSEEHSLKA